jgi:hypothetical protein
MTLILLMLAAFLAGFIDAAAGGGGLIQVPALMVLLPQAAPALIFGTNKFSSVWGTGLATWRYAQQIKPDTRILLPTSVAALVFGALGAKCVSLVSPALFKPLLIPLLIGVLAYTLKRKDWGQQHQPRGAWPSALLLGVVLGFYDGFLGPGTGSFLILAFVVWFGFGFIEASASAKWINLLTNLAAVSWFAWHGQVLYAYAVPMALCNLLGGYLGSGWALKHGSAGVRKVLIAVVGLLLLKLGWDVLHA